MATIYLMCGRKAWHYDVPDGWKETHWERFDYVECGVFEKPDNELTQDDRDNWVAHYSDEPDGWIDPSPVKER